jgi:hypothetical protein
MRAGLAACLAAVALAACGGEDGEDGEEERARPEAVPAGWQTMVDERTGLQFAYPPTWREKAPLLVEDGRGSVCGLTNFSFPGGGGDRDVMALTRAAVEAHESEPPEKAMDVRRDVVAGGPAGRFEIQGAFNGVPDPGPIVTVAVVDFGSRPDLMHCNGSFHDRYEKNKALFERIVRTVAPAGAD